MTLDQLAVVRLYRFACHLWMLAQAADGRPTVELDVALVRSAAADIVTTLDSAGGVNAALVPPAMDGHDDLHAGNPSDAPPAPGPSLSSAAGGPPGLCPDCHHTLALHRLGLGCTTITGVLGPGIGQASYCPCTRADADA